MKKIIFISAFLVLFLSINQLTAYDSTTAKFYPLAIGNVWSYHHTPYGNTVCQPLTNTSDYILSIVGDTVMPNNKRYFQFSNGYCERIDSNTMNVYRYMGAFELLIDSLLARKNDHFYGYRLDFFNYICTVTDTFQYNFANASWNAKTINLTANGTNEYTLARGLGITRIYQCFHSGYEDHLNGCIINGIQYGNILGKEENNYSTPLAFFLSQNYPNPFNPTTRIKFDIPLSLSFGEGQRVRLSIYDALGKEVTTLVNENLKPGTYETEWNASNYPSGIYFYKLDAGDYSETKKMVLIK